MAVRKIGPLAQASIILALASSAVGVGFFAPNVAFSVAALPFVGAVLCKRRVTRAIWVVPYFGAIAAIAGWGLVQMGQPVLLVTGLAGLGVAVCLMLVSLLGTAGAVALLAFIPFVPGSPLLATGSLLPGAGGLAPFAVMIAALFIERVPVGWTRAAVLAGTAASGFAFSYVMFAPLQESARPAAQWEEVALDIPRALSLPSQSLATQQAMLPNGTYITGENQIRSNNHALFTGWCNFAQQNNSVIYLGIEDAMTGRARVGVVRPDQDCGETTPAYAALVGIPGLTGGWMPEIPVAVQDQDTLADTGWLACFEGFSLMSWSGIGLSGHKTVVVVSNDVWTDPIPVARLRRKIGAEFARLLGITVVFADRGHTLLKLTNSEDLL